MISSRVQNIDCANTEEPPNKGQVEDNIILYNVNSAVLSFVERLTYLEVS